MKVKGATRQDSRSAGGARLVDGGLDAPACWISGILYAPGVQDLPVRRREHEEHTDLVDLIDDAALSAPRDLDDLDRGSAPCSVLSWFVVAALVRL